MRLLVTFFVGYAWLVAGAVPVFADDYFTLVVSGATGGREYVDTYDRWRQDLVSALRVQAEFKDDHLLVLAETPGPGVGRASRDGVAQAFHELRQRMTGASVLFVVLLGHGTFDGIDAKFNLVGPDLDAREWGSMLDGLPGRAVFVNTAAASFPFVRQLARPGRVVISATASAAQRYDTVFPEFFVQAIVQASADADKSGRVSVWEAFEFASTEVRRWFQRQGRLATEHAVLDDTGDGIGREAGEDGRDGPLAARIFVGAGADPSSETTDPVLAPLVARRTLLEQRVAELRRQKADLDPGVYESQLEQLLIELARVSRDIRRRTPSS